MMNILLGSSAADGQRYLILSSPRSTSVIYTNPATMLQKFIDNYGLMTTSSCLRFNHTKFGDNYLEIM